MTYIKRKILCILLVCCLLLFAGCREPVPPQVNLPATEPSITAVEPTAGTTETTTAATKPEETQATEAATTPTEPLATEIATILTEPQAEVATQEISTAMGVAPTDPSAFETETTSPPEIEAPPEEAPVSTVSTEVTIINLDCRLTMSVGNQYGSDAYGWTVDLSLNEANAGFNFGSRVFADEGQAAPDAAGIGQIDFLYNNLKASYPDMEITDIHFRVHAFVCGDGLYEVRVYYA